MKSLLNLVLAVMADRIPLPEVALYWSDRVGRFNGIIS
jgi:hypothetical protein